MLSEAGPLLDACTAFRTCQQSVMQMYVQYYIFSAAVL
jgi:hypothetical protein